jgi:hypothetical protein
MEIADMITEKAIAVSSGAIAGIIFPAFIALESHRPRNRVASLTLCFLAKLVAETRFLFRGERGDR